MAVSEALACLALAALALIFWKLQFLDPPTGQRGIGNLGTLDLFTEVVPLARETSRQWLEGHLPLWNPYQSGGRPLLAMPVAAVLYPPNILYTLLPAPEAIEMLVVLHLAAFGIFTYAFARALPLSRVAAFGSGLCIMLSGFATGIAVWTPVAVATCAWLPLALLAVRKIATGSHAGWTAVLALAVCMALLAGWTQAWVYSMYALGLFALLCLAQRGTAEPRSTARIAGWLAAGIALGIGASAIQILPSLELQALSPRPGGVGEAVQNPFGLPPISRIFEQMASPVPDEPRRLYIGVVALLLLPLSLFSRGRWVPVACFGGLGLLALAVTVSADAVKAMQLVPGFSLFRFPHRMGFLYAFGGAVLLGVTLDDLRRGSPRRRALWLGALVLALAAGLQSAAPLGDRGAVYLWVGTALIVLALLAPLRLARVAIVCGLVGVLGVDLFLASRSQLPRPIHAPAIVSAEAALYDRLRSKQGFDRSLMSRSGLATRDLRATRERIYSITDYSALSLGRTGAFFDLIEKRKRPRTHPFMGLVRPDPAHPSLGILELMSLRFIVGPPTESNGLRRAFARRSVKWREVDRGKGPLRVYEHPSPLPRAYVAFQAIEADSGQAALAEIGAPGFDPRRAVVVEGRASIPAQPTARVAPARILDYEPSEVHIEARTDRPALLVLTDSHYPGWVAEIDGQNAEILAANYLFRAVALPPGNHRVTFRYAPNSVRLGAAISLLSLVCLAVLLVAARCHGKRTRPAASRSRR